MYPYTGARKSVAFTLAVIFSTLSKATNPPTMAAKLIDRILPLGQILAYSIA